ncbi:MAG TPA: hypothetical protein PLX23_08720 [Candidatus Hydrogenedens sp.]|nr:hypothetical protein [Candidatus Hydrogenedens sp.]
MNIRSSRNKRRKATTPIIIKATMKRIHFSFLDNRGFILLPDI